jgi:hypothetical protein
MSHRLNKRALGWIALLLAACTGQGVQLTTVGGGAAGASAGGAGATSTSGAGESNGGCDAGGAPAGGVGGLASLGGAPAGGVGGLASLGGAPAGGVGGLASLGGAEPAEGGAATENEPGSSIDEIATGAGKCLPRTLPLNADLSPNCKVFGATASASCDCTAPGRAPTSDAVASSVRRQLAAQGGCDATSTPACSSFCACEVSEATGASEQDCLTNPTPAATSTGWCYVAPAAGIGSAAVVSACPSNEKQLLVFLGDAQAMSGEDFFLACAN